MKNKFQNLAKLGLATVLLATVSCRNDDKPVDIHEHEEADKMEITYTEVGTTNAQSVAYVVGTGTNGKMNLVNGKTYNVAVKFFHDNEDLTPEILEEVDEHFMQYEFADMNVQISRATTSSEKRADGKYIGLTSTWVVNSTPSPTSKVKMELLHQPENVNDTANNGGGSSNGGEPDVSVTIDID